MEDKQQQQPRSYTPAALALLGMIIFMTLLLGRYITTKHADDSAMVIVLTQNLGPCKNNTMCDVTCKKAYADGEGICDVTSTCQCRYQVKQSPSPPKPRCLADIPEGCNRTCHDSCCNDMCAYKYFDGRGFCSTTQPVYSVALCSCDFSC